MGFDTNPENINIAGRPKGSKNKISTEVSRVLVKLLECFNDEDIEKVAEELKTKSGIASLAKLLGSIAPKETAIDLTEFTQSPMAEAIKAMRESTVVQNDTTDISNADTKPKAD